MQISLAFFLNVSRSLQYQNFPKCVESSVFFVNTLRYMMFSRSFTRTIPSFSQRSVILAPRRCYGKLRPVFFISPH